MAGKQDAETMHQFSDIALTNHIAYSVLMSFIMQSTEQAE